MTRPILYSVAWIACLLWLGLCWWWTPRRDSLRHGSAYDLGAPYGDCMIRDLDA